MSADQKKSLNEINWNHLFYFSRVAAAGSIKEAAGNLGLSPSTLSEHITQLESDLDTLLFRRQYRKLTLTPEGARLFQHTKQLFDSGAKIRDIVSAETAPCYPANVGVVPNPLVVTAYKIVGDYLEHCGPISMKFHETKHEELEKGLGTGLFDFGFSNRASTRKDISHQILSTSELGFYVSTDLAGKAFTKLISDLPLLICNTEGSADLLPNELLGGSETGSIPIVASDYPFILHKLCKRGLGIGVFTEEFIQGMDSEGLNPIPVRDAPRLKTKIYVLWHRDAASSGPVKDLKLVLDKMK